MSDQENQWIVVCKPKRKHIKKGKGQQRKQNCKAVYSIGKPLYVVENEAQDLESFLQSDCMRVNFQLLKLRIQNKSVLKMANNVIHIECLGLGDFIKYEKPRYQYYFLTKLLLPLCQSFKPVSISVNCFDPIFSEDCIQQVTKLGTCKDSNDLQSKQAFIILFMPHCERFLYERYCQKFKDGNVLVIGNSIKQYIGRCQLIGEQPPTCFTKIANIEEQRIKDFRESLNDTFCYYI